MSSAIVHYHLSPYSISQHLFKVTVSVPAIAQSTVDLSLPAWIPGSYMIRDFAKNIGLTQALGPNGESLDVEKRSKQQWRVTSNGNAFSFSYVVYAFDLSVRSAYMDDEMGFINGTSAFVQVDTLDDYQCQVTLAKGHEAACQNWRVRTAMPCSSHDGDGYGDYTADDYQALIDYPILFGHFCEHSFDHEGIRFSLIFSGDTPLDLTRMETDLKPILTQQIALFNDKPPIDEYLFITLLTESAFGGLEHMNSTVLMYSRWDLPLIGESANMTPGYRDFLALCSHEFLHTWHVKRTRPQPFEQYQLDAESYTEQLWIYEGFTSFYDDVALARSGVITPESYLEMLGKNLTRLIRTAGRFKQSAAESSFDAWTRFYQQDANSINHIVSYYTKGGFIALCLDVYLRQQSNNSVSLDSIMERLWKQYGKVGKGTPDDVIEQLIQQTIQQDASALIDQLVRQSGELPLSDTFAAIGVELHLSHVNSIDDLGGKAPTQPITTTLGINVKVADTGVIVTQVREMGNGCRAGLQTGDKLIAVNQWAVNTQNLARLVSVAKDDITLSVLRGGRLLTLQTTIQPTIAEIAYLTIKDATTFHQWLGISQP